MAEDRHHERPDWNAIYSEQDQLWSGKVNGSLAVEVSGLTPGRALDVGCGEGADALWLAEQGWTVTGVDLAEAAIRRAEAEATSRGIDVEWAAVDIVDNPPPEVSFDLVTVHYPAFEIARRASTVEMLTNSVAPGGTLLAVGHAPPEDLESAPFDPADYVQPADIAADLGPEWTIEVHETRERPGEHHHGSPHSHDVVVRARKA